MRLIEALQVAGWPESELGNALAIISREDPTGDPTTPSGFNQFGTEDSWGLFQINRRAHPQYSVADLQNPVYNARVALGLWQAAGNYRDWSTAVGLNLPPYGSTRYSVSDFSSLANVEVGGGASGSASTVTRASASTPTQQLSLVGLFVALAVVSIVAEEM